MEVHQLEEIGVSLIGVEVGVVAVGVGVGIGVEVRAGAGVGIAIGIGVEVGVGAQKGTGEEAIVGAQVLRSPRRKRMIQNAAVQDGHLSLGVALVEAEVGVGAHVEIEAVLHVEIHVGVGVGVGAGVRVGVGVVAEVPDKTKVRALLEVITKEKGNQVHPPLRIRRIRQKTSHKYGCLNMISSWLNLENWKRNMQNKIIYFHNGQNVIYSSGEK